MQTWQGKKSAEYSEGRQRGNNKYIQNIIKGEKNISWVIAVSGESHINNKNKYILKNKLLY